eukprot:gene16706-22972_t
MHVSARLYLRFLHGASPRGLASTLLTCPPLLAQYSTSQNGSNEGVKKALNSLYRLVHPDLFHEHKTAKEANEKSFKLLQEYLHQARHGNPDLPAARVAYHFNFHLHLHPTAPGTSGATPNGSPSPSSTPSASASNATVSASAASATSSSTTTGATPPAPASTSSSTEATPPAPASSSGTNKATPPATAHNGSFSSSSGSEPGVSSTTTAEKQFHIVSVSLPAPTRHLSTSKELSNVSKKGLAKLLAACGIEAPFAVNLRDSTALRQREADSYEPAIRMANLRGAFRLTKELIVSFDTDSEAGQGSTSSSPEGGAESLRSTVRQVQLLEALSRIMHNMPDLDLRGCHLKIGHKLCIDRLGCFLHLDSKADEASWSIFLEGVDLEFVRNRRQYIRSINRLQDSVAQAVGVSMVYSAPAVCAAEPPYRQFLERVADYMKNRIAGESCLCG